MWLPTKFGWFLGLKEWATMPGWPTLYLKLVIVDTSFLMYTQNCWSVFVCLCIYIIWRILCNAISYSRNDHVYPAFLFPSTLTCFSLQTTHYISSPQLLLFVNMDLHESSVATVSLTSLKEISSVLAIKPPSVFQDMDEYTKISLPKYYTNNMFLFYYCEETPWPSFIMVVN